MKFKSFSGKKMIRFFKNELFNAKLFLFNIKSLNDLKKLINDGFNLKSQKEILNSK